MIEIKKASMKKALSYREALSSVCREKKYLASSRGFTEAETIVFVQTILLYKYTQYFACDGERVIGWCDIIPRPREYYAHVGILGIGIIREYRGRGIGKKLLEKAIAHARKRGIEKIELEVFTGNTRALGLYRTMGFEIEGIRRKGKKYRNKYEDVILMGLQL